MMIYGTKAKGNNRKAKMVKGRKGKKKEEKATVQKAGLENPLVQKFGSRCREFEGASQYTKA